MKICLVTAFPPSRRGLSEYGYHIARELQRDPLLSLTILSDQLEAAEAELADFHVIRCWRSNGLTNPVRLVRRLRELKPDVVWFNLLFSTFGEEPLPAFAGLAIPAISRLSGIYTHVTLHHLMDNVNLKDAGVRYRRLYRAAGYVATRMLLMANSVSVLLPAYRRTLMEKYRGKDVHFRYHGIFAGRPEFPNFTLRGNPEHRILAFGKWGTYKRLEILMEAFAHIVKIMPHARLIVAGSDHPATPGYVQSVAERYGSEPSVTFTGYVAEESIPELFRSSSLLVMPYTSATGASGVAHLACQYGLPIVSAGIPDFREMADDENMAMSFYPTGDALALADELISLLGDSNRQREMAEQNFSAALRMTMPQVVRQYTRSFALHQHTRALEPIGRFRRLPAWVPSRSSLFRAAVPRWEAWM